jgi:signal transduction histidine kinase
MAKIKKHISSFPFQMCYVIILLISLKIQILSSPIDSMFTESNKNTFSPIISDAYGVSFRDVNNDGLSDLYIVCFRNLNRLLIRNGNNHTFKDETILSGLGGNLMPGKLSNLELGLMVADFNNDSEIEFIIAGWNNTTRFFTNQGDLSFRSYHYNLGIKFRHDFNGVISGDVDNDGDLDLYFTDEHYSNRLFINRGTAVFDDETAQRGLEFNGISQGASFADVDGDGDLDLYVTNWQNADLFYRNDGNGFFENTELDIKVCKEKISTNAVTFSDIDNDGDSDFFVTSRDGRNYLYSNRTVANDSNWYFVDVSDKFNLIDSCTSYGSVIADFNNDGWQDIFVTNIGPNQFYLNQKGKFFKKLFEDKSDNTRNLKGYSTGAAFADYDLDGDLDLFVSNKDTFCLLYNNPTNDSAFIKFQLHGVNSNRDAIGSRIELYKNNHIDDKNYLIATREISGGSGYLSLNDLVVHFGIDTVDVVDAKIIFPSQKTITFTALQKGELYEVYEYSGLIGSIILTYNYSILLIQDMSFWYNFGLIVLFIFFTFTFIRLGLKRYLWIPASATGFVSGYFLITLLIIAILNQLESVYILLALNFISILFILLFILFSERIRKLYSSRKRYHSVLIDLINQIIKIRDDEELINTVSEGIIKNVYFNKVCIFLLNQHDNSISKITNIGFNTNKIKLNELIDKHDSIPKIKNISFETDKNNGLIAELKADVLFPVSHENNFYGMLILGTSNPGFKLNDEDIELYSSLTNQIAVTLENNEYIRKSNEFVKKLTESKVREQYLKKLEETNNTLDLKNKELQTLYDELKNTQSQLIQSEKMSSLGQLVAGISHELNNPIGFIYSNSNQLQKYIDKVENVLQDSKNDGKDFIKNVLPDVKGLIEDTLSGSKIVKELVDNLRRFSHLDQAKKQNVDIHEGIESSLKIIHSQLKNRINIHNNFNATKTVECNPGQINQVLLNILSNAAQSIENEGNIWIDTGEENDYLFIKIKDDGKGIEKENLKQIFDPFFTTKAVGEGTGLGLSISYSIIKNHSGTIEIESEINKGSIFIIKLPFK